uniref:No apical meristem-associated C-terminal domain-containing protein n=1 Tax=Hordeum vulgare subsp. vulgare TaxID=112509 RepID=A0A8I7B9Y5_HORVV
MQTEKRFPVDRVYWRVSFTRPPTRLLLVEINTPGPRSWKTETSCSRHPPASVHRPSKLAGDHSPLMDGDESFLDTMGFGYTQTQLESPIEEQPTPSTQHQATPITEKAKSNKGKNWSSEEDKILIAAWGNASLDSVGTDQNRDAYWARILEYYNSHKMSSWPERNDNAINCRYTLINKDTARFCGCLQQILNREESGRTIEEKTNDAHIMFKEMDLKKKKPFTLMHCYVELSKYPKWQTKELETSRKKQKKTVGASPGTFTNDLADASSVRTDATSIHRDALEH